MANNSASSVAVISKLSISEMPNASLLPRETPFTFTAPLITTK